MREGSLAYAEGILDVSVVVPACFENPLRRESANFVRDVLDQKKRFVLPISAVFGAYHIAARYLHVPRSSVKDILGQLLQTGSPSLYPYVRAETALVALDYAAIHGIESWDGYLVALAMQTKAKVIFTLDEELKRKIKEVVVVSPFDPVKVREYHRFLTKKIECV